MHINATVIYITINRTNIIIKPLFIMKKQG